jgi:hypothetical protein
VCGAAAATVHGGCNCPHLLRPNAAVTVCLLEGGSAALQTIGQRWLRQRKRARQAIHQLRCSLAEVRTQGPLYTQQAAAAAAEHDKSQSMCITLGASMPYAPQDKDAMQWIATAYHQDACLIGAQQRSVVLHHCKTARAFNRQSTDAYTGLTCTPP